MKFLKYLTESLFTAIETDHLITDRQYKMTITHFKKNISFLFILFTVTLNVSARENVYIFYPSVLDPHSFQDSIAHVLKGVSVTVFGRYENFIEKATNEPPNGVITKKILVEKQLNDYKISLSGEKKGKIETNYIILSTDKQLDVESINKSTVIGVTDILGRKDMRIFLSEFFPTVPKFKRVPKVADLLSMLSFGAVSGIMIQDVFLDYFKSTSQLEFFTSPLPATPNGSPVFAVNKDKNAKKSISLLKANNQVICNLFYIDQWK